MNEFIDKRDGNKYKVVKIGDLIWFAENLRYQGVPHHFPDRDSGNVPEYGCLYTLYDAMKACPPGWRLPAKEDFDDLLTATGANSSSSSSIRASSWLNGSNSSGFGALPAGDRSNIGNFYYFCSCSFFWSVTPYSSSRAHSLFVGFNSTDVSSNDFNYAFSVRYVKEI